MYNRQILHLRLHQLEMPVRLQIECCRRIVLSDLASNQSTPTNHRNEVKQSITHISRLKGQGVTSGHHSIRFPVYPLVFGKCSTQPSHSMAPMYDCLRGMLSNRSDSVEMRRSKSKHSMHEIVVLLRKFWDLVYPHCFVSKWQMRICHGKEVVKQSHVRHGEGIIR